MTWQRAQLEKGVIGPGGWRMMAAPFLALVCACGGDGPPGDVAVRAARGVSGGEILISTADAVIGSAADLMLDDQGRVYVVDRQASQVHIVEGDGSRRSLGRPGAGPGELSQPSSALRQGDTLLIVDWGNGRLQGLSPSGVSLFTRPLPPGYPPTLGVDGRFVRPTLGADSALAVIHSRDLAPVVSIGQSVGTPSNRVQVGRMKQEIQEGKVPAIFLNTAETAIGADGTTWLWVPARGTIQLFDSLGSEVFESTLDEPERETLFEQFVVDNAARPGNSFAALRYIADAAIVGDDLWVLLGSSLVGPAAIRVVHPDGSFGSRLDFPGVVGAGLLAIDLERGMGYFVIEDAAELVRVQLSAADTTRTR